MQKTVVTVTDDLTGKEANGIETVTFAVEGKAYEIDLNPLNRANFMRSVKKYMEHGRKVGSRSGNGRRATHPKEYVHTVRQWAREHGVEVADRGRIPQSVYRAYEEATTR